MDWSTLATLWMEGKDFTWSQDESMLFVEGLGPVRVYRGKEAFMTRLMRFVVWKMERRRVLAADWRRNTRR